MVLMKMRQRGLIIMKTKITILFMLIILFTSCANTHTVNNVEHNINDINYIKDSRSNLCFARLGSISSYNYIIISISEVPCEKVEHLLQK